MKVAGGYTVMLHATDAKKDQLLIMIDRGTASVIRQRGFPLPAAGKTGTTNDAKDVWFVGMTPGMVASVWIGNDDSSSLPSSMTLSNGNTDSVTSSRQPIYAWNDFVENALRGRPSGGGGFPVGAVLVENGQPVEFGQPLFVIE